MAGEGTKKEQEHRDPKLNPEQRHQPGKQEDPTWKRNKPDQYDENQGGGLPPVEQAGKQSGQQAQKSNPEQQGNKHTGQNDGPEERHDRGKGREGSAQKWDVQERDRNKGNKEMDEHGVNQGQKH